MRQELEHVRRGHLDRVLPGHLEEHLQVEGHRSQRVRPALARHELQIPIHQPVTQRVRTSPNPDTVRTRHGKLLIPAPSHHRKQQTPIHQNGAWRLTGHPFRCEPKDLARQRACRHLGGYESRLGSRSWCLGWLIALICGSLPVVSKTAH
jgi:hypothetical protein